MKVADAQVVHDGIDGLPAYADRATPRRTQGKQQRQGESDHGRKPADEQGRPPTAVQRQGSGVHDQRHPGEEQYGHVKGGELT